MKLTAPSLPRDRLFLRPTWTCECNGTSESLSRIKTEMIEVVRVDDDDEAQEERRRKNVDQGCLSVAVHPSVGSRCAQQKDAI